MRKRLVGTAGGVAVVIACSGPTTIDIEKYDRSCKSVGDCVLVATDACCPCNENAINMSSKAQYDADFAAAKKNCGSVPCPGIACPSVIVVCAMGVCNTAAPPVDAGPG